MIDQFFTFTECDEVDQLAIVYEKIKLICAIGEHPPDVKFDWARVDYVNGILVLGNNNHEESNAPNTEWRYPLSLNIGQLLT